MKHATIAAFVIGSITTTVILSIRKAIYEYQQYQHHVEMYRQK